MAAKLYEIILFIYNIFFGGIEQTLLTLALILTFVIIDKVALSFKVTTIFIKTWQAVWETVKLMGNWRGVLSLLIVWLTLSGSGLILLGWLIGSKELVGQGLMIYFFWLLPATPLMAITIGFALMFQRLVLRDKTVAWTNIKEIFKNIFTKQKEEK